MFLPNPADSPGVGNKEDPGTGNSDVGEVGFVSLAMEISEIPSSSCRVFETPNATTRKPRTSPFRSSDCRSVTFLPKRRMGSTLNVYASKCFNNKRVASTKWEADL